MMQSSLHCAIIMDGNGRWAQARGLPRIAGHREGASAVRRAVEAAPHLDIGTLTLFAFSSDNWKRPPEEVDALMLLFADYLEAETPGLLENGVRLEVIGRRDRLDPAVTGRIEQTELATASGRRLRLRIAIDYSGRDAISRGAIGPEVDLLIRTGGEQRLSDFLLWECAYAELFFSPRMWPDFGMADLRLALRHFHRRERRFGGVGNGVPEAAHLWLD